MGIEEMVLERARKKGLQEGLQQAEEKKNFEFVKNLLMQTDLPIDKIASLANVTEAFVLKVKSELK